MAGLSENQECYDLVSWLKALRPRPLFCHVPNGGFRRGHSARVFSMLGVVKGVPDYLIFEPGEWGCGIALEMKRAKRATVRPHQRVWIEGLRARGWCAFVAFGADDARRQLREIGFCGAFEEPGGSPLGDG